MPPLGQYGINIVFVARCSRYTVTKANPIHFIDGKCFNYKELKGKSPKTSLTNHIVSISHYITSLVINDLGVDKHTYTDIADKSYWLLMISGQTDTYTDIADKSSFKKPGLKSVN